MDNAGLLAVMLAAIRTGAQLELCFITPAQERDIARLEAGLREAGHSV